MIEPLFDIIALTWNNKQVTRDFVESFLGNTAISTRLIIIDNGSSDGTTEYLSSLKDSGNCIIKVVLNRENKGFVGGMNQGIEASNAPYVCLANNDLIFTKGWLEEIISVFKKYDNIGVLNPNSNNLGTPPASGNSLEGFAKDLRNKYEGIFVEMPFCIGFCMVIKREIIDKIGGFSEEFAPLFFEDSDYSMKVKREGFLIGMAKGSYVWHKEHASVDKLGRKKEELFTKSKRIFLKKWGSILRIAWVVDSCQELLDNLENGIRLARGGNYIWFFVNNFFEQKSAIFKKNNLVEHSGVKFIEFRNVFDLSWKILKKKKRYDIIMGKDKFIMRIFSKMGYKILDRLDETEVDKIKMASNFCGL